jgi:hypothetical protein
MPCLRQRGIVISVFAILSALIASCGESKVSQCNKLIDVANKAVSDVQAITASANPQDVTAMTRIAETADQARGSMEALELADDQLETFRQQFVTMYTETSQATRDLVTAVNAKNSQNAETAYNALQTATDKETPLVTEVNTYCGGTPQTTP